MSFERICKILEGDSPGRVTELNYYRIGPDRAGKKVYLQAAIHADEQPGMLVLHHLLQLLRPRVTQKYVWRDAGISRIVDTEILESRGKYLLSD